MPIDIDPDAPLRKRVYCVRNPSLGNNEWWPCLLFPRGVPQIQEMMNGRNNNNNSNAQNDGSDYAAFDFFHTPRRVEEVKFAHMGSLVNTRRSDDPSPQLYWLGKKLPELDGREIAQFKCRLRFRAHSDGDELVPWGDWVAQKEFTLELPDELLEAIGKEVMPLCAHGGYLDNDSDESEEETETEQSATAQQIHDKENHPPQAAAAAAAAAAANVNDNDPNQTPHNQKEPNDDDDCKPRSKIKAATDEQPPAPKKAIGEETVTATAAATTKHAEDSVAPDADGDAMVQDETVTDAAVATAKCAEDSEAPDADADDAIVKDETMTDATAAAVTAKYAEDSEAPDAPDDTIVQDETMTDATATAATAEQPLGMEADETLAADDAAEDVVQDELMKDASKEHDENDTSVNDDAPETGVDDAPSTAESKISGCVALEQPLPTLQDVQDILERYGFTVNAKGVWKRPQSKETFADGNALRRDLCANGIRCAPDHLSEEDQDKLVLWVRTAIVDDDNTTKNSSSSAPRYYRELKTEYPALKLLLRMGLQKRSTPVGEKVYALPGVDANGHKLGVNAFPEMATSPEMHWQTWFARYGLDVLDKAAVAPEELLGLQLFLSEPAKDTRAWTFGDLGEIDQALHAEGKTRSRSSPHKPRSKVVEIRKNSPKPEVITEPSSEHEPITFASVRPLLIKCGFKFGSNFFGRPGTLVKPKKRGGKKQKLGTDYFNTEHEFRVHLCAHGLDCDKWVLTDDEAHELALWVRTTFVDANAPEPSSLPKPYTVVQWLKQMGMKSSNPLGLGAVFELPSQTRCTTREIPEEGNYSTLFTCLARFGLDGFDTTKLETSELHALQWFLTNPTGVLIDTFGPSPEIPSIVTAPSQSSPGSTKRRSSRLGTNSGPVQSSPSNKGSRRSNHIDTRVSSPSTATAVTLDSPTSAIPTKGGTKRNSPATRNTRSAKKSKLSLEATVSDNDMEEEYVEAANEATWRDLFDLVTEEANEAAETTNCTPEEELEKCLEGLGESTSISGVAAVSRDTDYGRNLQRVYDFAMGTVMEDDDESLPPSLYVCGQPGVGKTTGVRWCLDRAAQAYEEIKNKGAVTSSLRTCFVSAGSLTPANSEQRVFSDLAQTLNSRCADSKRLRASLSRNKKGPHVFLVLDEIDHLVSEAPGQKRARNEKLLEQMFEWSADPDLRFTLIGIANSLGNWKFDRLQQIGTGLADSVAFSTYSEKEIVLILRQRVPTPRVTDAVVRFIAKKVQQASGDARKALDHLAAAILNCRDKGDTVVKMPHATKIFQTNKNSQALVEGLPAISKIILCVVLTVSKANMDEPLTLITLKQFVAECAMEGNKEEELVSMEDFQLLFDTLVDHGLLVQQQQSSSNNNMPVDMRQQQEQPIFLGNQLEDVEKILESELLQRPFYQNLRVRAENLSRNN